MKRFRKQKEQEGDFDEVERLKRQTHQIAQEADDATVRLNKLLRRNGITLKLYIAAGGKHHGD